MLIEIMDFTGLSAFPLTPMDERSVDESAFEQLVARLAEAGADSIGALGSTGNFAYLERDERARLGRLAVAAAAGTPVVIGIGAVRTRQVLELAEDAQNAGAAALLLPPVSYQPLTAGEVFELYAQVSERVSVPLCVYDNQATTHFSFTDDLYRSLARLANVRAVKVPAPPSEQAGTRVPQLRALLEPDAVLGISGDALAAASLLAGAQAWFSVIGGVLPDVAVAITRAALAGQASSALMASERLHGFWELFAAHGSLRVVAAAATHLGLTRDDSLPRPLRPLDAEARQQLVRVIEELDVRR